MYLNQCSLTVLLEKRVIAAEILSHYPKLICKGW